jgi:homogentisate 1,2-dioxygenase
MLERRTEGEISAKPHSKFHPKSEPRGLASYEYVFTRDGFAGGFSIMHLRHEPNAIERQTPFQGDADRIIGVCSLDRESPFARRHIKTWEAPSGKNLLESRTALFRNETTRVSVIRGQAQADYAFANWTADELYFIQEGAGTLVTPFGFLTFDQHDYLLIPKGVPYRLEHTGKIEMLLIEATEHLGIPHDFRNPHGQLKLEAPYTHRNFRHPINPAGLLAKDYFTTIVALAGDSLVEQRYKLAPFQTYGWDGSVYPMAFHILDYLPKTGKYHLPPNLHLTFQSRDFAVCSFVPRMVDYGEGAIPCPYPHANVHCDEIIYYVRGNFTSRQGIGPRSISFHPVGQPHGPQPGNYLASMGHKQTDELAVMLDTWKPLKSTKYALEIEDRSYQQSWVPKS